VHSRPLTAAVLLPLFAAAATAQDPLVKQALSRIERVEQQEATLQPGDTKAANQLLTDLAWAGKRLNAVGKKDEHWQAAAQRHGAITAKVEAKSKAGAPPTGGKGEAPGYDAAKLAQLDKEIGNAIGNWQMVPRNLHADEFRQKSTQKEIADFERRLAEFPAADAAVTKVAAHCAEFRTGFESSMAALGKDRAGGDVVQQHLAELDAKYDDNAIPGELSYPYTEAQLRAWATEVKRWRDTEIPADLAFLTEAAQNAVVDQQHVSRLKHWLFDLRDRTLTQSTRLVAERLQSEVQHGIDLAEWILATDAKDQDQVANRILGKGAFDGNMTRLRDVQHAVEMARVHDQVMPGKWVPERDEQAATVGKAITHLQQLAVSTLDAVRVPAAASTDPYLLDVAAATLKKPGYGVGEWQRLVINTETVRHESREAWVTPGTVSTTISYYHYVWDQFQVTTAERQGDEVWLFANTLKRYESGDPTKKIGQWILSQRFELTRILPENVDK
jgi:hypothetical protein